MQTPSYSLSFAIVFDDLANGMIIMDAIRISMYLMTTCVTDNPVRMNYR